MTIGQDNVGWDVRIDPTAVADQPVPAHYDGNGRGRSRRLPPDDGQWFIAGLAPRPISFGAAGRRHPGAGRLRRRRASRDRRLPADDRQWFIQRPTGSAADLVRHARPRRPGPGRLRRRRQDRHRRLPADDGAMVHRGPNRQHTSARPARRRSSRSPPTTTARANAFRGLPADDGQWSSSAHSPAGSSSSDSRSGRAGPGRLRRRRQGGDRRLSADDRRVVRGWPLAVDRLRCGGGRYAGWGRLRRKRQGRARRLSADDGTMVHRRHIARAEGGPVRAGRARCRRSRGG